MLIRVALIASMLVLATSLASAEVTFTAATSVDSGNPITALAPGDVVTIDVTLRSDGEGTLAIGAAASGYDSAVASFSGGQTSAAVLVQVCIPAAGCFGGISNVAANIPLAQATDPVEGNFVQFLTAVSLAENLFTGETDPGIATGVAGDAQFRLTFTAEGPGDTPITIGAIDGLGNALVLVGGADGVSNNTVVTLTVPEPGEIASSLAALGSVFAVVAVRRRA